MTKSLTFLVILMTPAMQHRNTPCHANDLRCHSESSGDLAPGGMSKTYNTTLHDRDDLLKVMSAWISFKPRYDIDGLVQERRNPSALTMELRLCCTNLSILFETTSKCISGWISWLSLHRIYCKNANVSVRLSYYLYISSQGDNRISPGVNLSIKS